MRVALTGGIASGKSAVAEVWAQLGACIIDADLLAREAVAPGTPGERAVRERFPSVVGADGIDRAALGRIVFADEAARAELEAIVHPRVRALAADREAACLAGGGIPVHVIPLLVETQTADQLAAYDVVVVVDVEPETQLRRLMARNGLGVEEARARVAAQASRRRRLAAADMIIENDGSLAELRERARTAWEVIGRRALI